MGLDWIENLIECEFAGALHVGGFDLRLCQQIHPMAGIGSQTNHQVSAVRIHSVVLSLSAGESSSDALNSSEFEQTTDICLWERLGKAAMLNIESSSYHRVDDHAIGAPWLGARKWLEVRIPQARVAHNSSSEWLQIKEAAEKARYAATLAGDEVGEMTCSELLEALELSRCLFLMNYIHGSALMENSNSFGSRGIAQKVASALGRILMLDLIIRNEDRLPCRELGWRGNSANLLLADEKSSMDMEALQEAHDKRRDGCMCGAVSALSKDKRTTSVASRLEAHNPGYGSMGFDPLDIVQPPLSSKRQGSISGKKQILMNFTSLQ
ncbi:Dual specificity protein phosphatase PHS1-like protein [Drosera capensis]